MTNIKFAGAIQRVREEEVVVSRGAARRTPRVVQRDRHRQDQGTVQYTCFCYRIHVL